MPGSAPADDSSVPPRRLLVLLGSLPIEDGQTPPPTVGDVAGFTVRFIEAGPGAADAAVSAIRARAEPLGDGSPRGPGMRWDGTAHDWAPVWPTVLHGDGWSATWSAPRPVVGQVLLRGTLFHDLDIGVRTSVRGRVTRARVVTETIDTTDADQTTWRPIPATQRLRDVDTAPRWFDHGLVVPADAPASGWVVPVPADPYVVERGVLLDLDLDNVPAAAPRLRIVPGAVSAAGEDMWVTDTRLPLLLRVRRPLGNQPEITEHLWPGHILGAGLDQRRALHADRDGCWITGPDGIHRADPDGGVRLLDDRSASPLASTDQGLLLTATRPDPADPHSSAVLRLSAADGRSTDVALEDREVTAGVAAADGTGFVMLLRHRDHPPGTTSRGGQVDPRPWLGRVTATGDLVEGPYLEVGHPNLLALLATDPPLVLDQHGSGLRRVQADLTLADGTVARRPVLRAYAAGGRLWMATHPPHPDEIDRGGAEACRPVPGPPDHPEDRQYWLLTELDPTTLAPQLSTLVQHVPDGLTVDAEGTAWVVADGLRHLPTDPGAAARSFNIAGLLDAATASTDTTVDGTASDRAGGP